MKKGIVTALMLAGIFAATSAFANNPETWGDRRTDRTVRYEDNRLSKQERRQMRRADRNAYGRNYDRTYGRAYDNRYGRMQDMSTMDYETWQRNRMDNKLGDRLDGERMYENQMQRQERQMQRQREQQRRNLDTNRW